MGNFANWPRWIHACLAIVAVALAVAGLRAFPELSKLLSSQEETVSAKSEKVESKLTDVRIVTEKKKAHHSKVYLYGFRIEGHRQKK
jgi:hypothetical protein